MLKEKLFSDNKCGFEFNTSGVEEPYLNDLEAPSCHLHYSAL